jgi:uncharacterized membrane protein (UPF0136 family)
MPPRKELSTLPVVLFAGFGLFVILGGLMAFFQSGSVASIISAGSSGALLLFSANLMRSSKQRANGLRLAIGRNEILNSKLHHLIFFKHWFSTEILFIF